jgi:hypothetical protein
MNNRGFGATSSMFADVERPSTQINVSGDYKVDEKNISGDYIGGDKVGGDKAGGDIDKGPRLIDVGGDYNTGKPATSPNPAAAEEEGSQREVASSDRSDVNPSPPQQYSFCPFCQADLRQLSMPKFCYNCTRSLLSG